MVTETLFATLQAHLHRWTRRLRMVESLEWGPWGTASGLGLALLTALTARLWPILMTYHLAALAGILSLVGAVVALAVVWLRPRPMLSLSRVFDRRLALAERLSTAIEIEMGYLQAVQSMAQAQLADTVRAAQRTDYRSRLPLRPSRGALLTASVLILALVLSFMLPNPQEGVLLQRDAVRAAIEEQIEDLEALKEQLAETKGLTEAERETLLSELEEAIAKLEEGTATPEEALAALSEAEQALAELQDPGAARLEEGLERAGEQVADSELTKDLAEALAKGDYAAAAEALENYGGKVGEELTREEDLELARQLAEAAEALAESDPALAEQLAEAAEAIETGDIAEAREALKAAVEKMGEAGERVESQEAVEGVLAELQEGREEIGEASGLVPGDGKNPGKEGFLGIAGGETGGQQAGSGQQNKPGHHEDAGSGKPYDEDYDPERIGGEGEGVNVGREGEEGVTVGDVSIPAPEGGRSNVPYREVYSDYAKEAGAALEGSYIPLGMKQYVRDYFSSLEP
jgi:hypothetical protein